MSVEKTLAEQFQACERKGAMHTGKDMHPPEWVLLPEGMHEKILRALELANHWHTQDKYLSVQRERIAELEKHLRAVLVWIKKRVDYEQRIAELEKHLRKTANQLADCTSELDTEGLLDDTDKAELISVVAAARAALKGGMNGEQGC